MTLTKQNAYRAAPRRTSLSPLLELVLAWGLLSTDETFLDYGCGHGYDWQYLKRKGYNAAGYDPYYFPSTPGAADVVMLNYVLNVIEDPDERIATLQQAWALTKKRMMVAVLIGDEETVTRWNTYRKAFQHIEIRAIIDVATETICKPLGTGRYLIDKTFPKCIPRSKAEVKSEIAQIEQLGWVAPVGAYLQPYYTHKRRNEYYRLIHKKPVLPGNKRVIHIGSVDDDKYTWAQEGIRRRDEILDLKFHCREFCFLEEFHRMRHFPFLSLN